MFYNTLILYKVELLRVVGGDKEISNNSNIATKGARRDRFSSNIIK